MMNTHETKETEYGIYSCIKPYIDRYMGFNIKTKEICINLN